MQERYIKELYQEVCQNLEGEYKVILESKRDINEEWIEYDTVKWEIEDRVKPLIDELLQEKNLSFEDKILKVYEFICLNYIYDVNVLYFFKRDNSDPLNHKYIAVDWYGRVVGREWIEKRKKHNRRICYEFSRFYAKAINTLNTENKDVEAFMIGYKDNTHYVVALTGKDYSIVLDPDDFNNIKDLTRLKMGLSIRGIHILRDENGTFKKAIDKFNENRPDELAEIEKACEEYEKKDFIRYIKEAINIINKYNMDSQGFFEYIRYLVEKSEIEVEKIWKEDKNATERRYERCFYFEYEDKTYLVDSIDKNISEIDIKSLDEGLFVTNAEEHQYEYYGG